MLTLTIADFDRLPKLARQALAESLIIGNGDSRLRIKRAKAELMAARIRAADIMLAKDNNTIMPGCSLRAINDVLQGRK